MQLDAIVGVCICVCIRSEMHNHVRLNSTGGALGPSGAPQLGDPLHSV